MLPQTISTKQLSADGFCWSQYSPRVGTINNEISHFARVAYFAFDDWDLAHAFWKGITDKHCCTRAQVREALRFSTGWEVKVWGMSEAVLLKLIERDRNRTKPKSLPLLPIRRDWSISESHDASAIEAA